MDMDGRKERLTDGYIHGLLADSHSLYRYACYVFDKNILFLNWKIIIK